MDWHRTLSALVAATYVTLECASGGVLAAFILLTKILLPLVLIWFPEELEGYAAAIWLQNRPTLAVLVRLVGWTLLLMPIWLPVLVYIMRPLCGYQVTK
jgi:hypothetical protein